MNARGAVALLALASACSAAPPPRTVAASGSPRPRVVAPLRWEAVLLPDHTQFIPAGNEPDGSVDILFGSLRARVHGDIVDWSHDTTLHPIEAHAAVNGRWLFATTDGALLRADSFTGPLTRVGDANGHWLTSGFDSTGRVAVRADDGHLWLGSDEAFVPAPSPADGVLVDTGFIDEHFGVAVMAPGRLFRSLDGGAHFDPIDTGRVAPYVVYPNAGQFVLDTTGGLASVGAAGAPVAYSGPRGEWPRSISDDVAHALIASNPTENPFARATLLASGGVLLADGRIAAIGESGLYMIDRHGEVTHVAELPGSACRLFAWNGQVLVQCTADAREMSLATFDNGWHPLHRFEIGADVTLGSDAATLAVNGTCDGGLAPRDETPLCFFDGSAWRQRALPGGVHVLGVYGDAVLYQSVEMVQDHDVAVPARVEWLRVSDPDDGRTVTVESTTARLEEAHFATNGTVFGLAREGETERLAIGSLGRALAVRQLPAHVTRLSFVDASRGIAMGRHLGEIWTTTDAGEHWEPLSLRIDGDPSSASVVHGEGLDDVPAVEIDCTSSYCVVGSRVLWMSPELVPPTDGHVFAAEHAPPAERAPIRGVRDPGDPRQEGYHAGSGECSQDVPQPAFDPRVQRLYGGTAWLEPHRTRNGGALAGRYGFVWGGIDERGPFRAEARPVDLPAVVLPPTIGAQTNADDEGQIYLRAATRDLALVERCIGYRMNGGCDLVVIPRQTVAHIVEPRSLLAWTSAAVVLRNAIALDDGGIALHLSPPFSTPESEDALNPPARIDVVARLDARGNLAAQRGYAWGRERTIRMLGRNGRAPGLFVATAPHIRDVWFYSLDPADDGHLVGTVPAAQLAPCDTPAAPADAASMTADNTQFGATLSIGAGRFIVGGPSTLRTIVEFGQGQTACLRGLRFWSSNPADERALIGYLGGTPALRAEHGNLRGEAIDRGGVRPLTCHW